jgi:hypothetical protein
VGGILRCKFQSTEGMKNKANEDPYNLNDKMGVWGDHSGCVV